MDLSFNSDSKKLIGVNYEFMINFGLHLSFVMLDRANKGMGILFG